MEFFCPLPCSVPMRLSKLEWMHKSKPEPPPCWERMERKTVAILCVLHGAREWPGYTSDLGFGFGDSLWSTMVVRGLRFQAAIDLCLTAKDGADHWGA